MAPEVVVFLVLSYGACATMFAYFGWRSYRRRRVDPGLWLCLATLSLGWMESPYDWSMYAQFHPDLPKFPDWGPIGMTHGGLPQMAPFGYVAYFVTPALLAVGLVNRMVTGAPSRGCERRSASGGAVGGGLRGRGTPRIARDWNRPMALLGVGLAVGFVWDFTWELIGTATGVWRFARAAPGLVLFAGDTNQVALYVPLAMGFMIMGATYLLGRTDDTGVAVLQTWARRRASTGPRAGALALLGFVVAVHAIYVTGFIPHLVAKQAGLNTTVAADEVYDGDDLVNQPE